MAALVGDDDNVLEGGVDCLIPPALRKTCAGMINPYKTIVISYGPPVGSSAAAATLRASSAPTGTGGELGGGAHDAEGGADFGSSPPTGQSRVRFVPTIRRHRTELEAAMAAERFSSDPLSGHSPPPADSPISRGVGHSNVKQALLEHLGIRSDENTTLLVGPTGRPLPQPTMEEEVRSRLRGDRCDATRLTSPVLLVRLVRLIVAHVTDPTRSFLGCVTSVDVSYTNIGKVGPTDPPLRFDAQGNAIPMALPPNTRFFPDEAVPRERTSDKVRRRVAQRSLALCYVSPLLFVRGRRNYRVREFRCTHAHLTDEDAYALGLILRTKPSEQRSCSLEVIDLSFNHIANEGARYLANALKHNLRLRSLQLAGNDGVTDQKTLAEIERRLRGNREGNRRIPWFRRVR